MNLGIETIISIVLASVLVISYIGLKLRRKHLGYDKGYDEIYEEQLRADKREQTEEENMEDYMIYSDNQE